MKTYKKSELMAFIAPSLAEQTAKEVEVFVVIDSIDKK